MFRIRQGHASASDPARGGSTRPMRGPLNRHEPSVRADTITRSTHMNRTIFATALIAGAAFATSFAASAQATTATSTLQRDAKQEQRIENGLQDGTITPREDAKLQRDEAKVDKLQSRALRDGSLSASDKARLDA